MIKNSLIEVKCTDGKDDFTQLVSLLLYKIVTVRRPPNFELVCNHWIG